MSQSGQVQFFTKEQVLSGGAISGVPSLTATDISFDPSDNSINSTSSDFLTTGFVSGMLVVISGSSGNNLQFVIQEALAHKLKVIDGSVTPEVAGASITIGPSYVLLANQGNTPDAKLDERSWICTVCNQSFPESKIRKFRGKYYCIPNGDYKDIGAILKLERARRYKPDGIGRERIVPPIIKG